METSAVAVALGEQLILVREFNDHTRAFREAETFAELGFDVECTTIAAVTVADRVLRSYRLRVWTRDADDEVRVAVKALALVNR